MSKVDLHNALLNNRRGFTVLRSIGLVTPAMAVQNQARNMVAHACKKLALICNNECNTMTQAISEW